MRLMSRREHWPRRPCQLGQQRLHTPVHSGSAPSCMNLIDSRGTVHPASPPKTDSWFERSDIADISVNRSMRQFYKLSEASRAEETGLLATASLQDAPHHLAQVQYQLLASEKRELFLPLDPHLLHLAIRSFCKSAWVPSIPLCLQDNIHFCKI